MCLFASQLFLNNKLSGEDPGNCEREPAPPVPFLSLSFFLPPLPTLLLPLEVWPLEPARSGIAVSSHSRVRGGAQAENEFGTL